jgi:hypothetical protein
MSLRFMLGVAVGAAGGYAVGRVMEARAHGVPLDLAFKHLGVSVMELRKRVLAANQAAADALRGVRRRAPVAAPQMEDIIDAEWQDA